MIDLNNIKEIYLSLGYTDMRKQADGLLVVVKSICKDIDLMNKLFIFCNKEKNKLKILEVDYDGIWVYYKRLNDSKFRWPKNGNDKIDKRQLSWLLEGLELYQKYAHKKISFSDVV